MGGNWQRQIQAGLPDLRTPLTRSRFRIEEIDDDKVRDGMIDEVEEMEQMIPTPVRATSAAAGSA